MRSISQSRCPSQRALALVSLAVLCIFEVATASATVGTPLLARRPTYTNVEVSGANIETLPSRSSLRRLQDLDELAAAAPELARTALELFIIGAVVLFAFKAYKRSTSPKSVRGGYAYQEQFNQQPNFAQPGFTQPGEIPGMNYEVSEVPPQPQNLYGQPF